MRLDDFDRKIIAARPSDYPANTHFVDEVMMSIKSNEILSSSVRKMNVTKKETFIMRLKHLPALAIIAIAIASILIVSGGAYAAYQLLWQKPEVNVSRPKISSSGRKEVAISFAQCGSSKLAEGYELKKNATITIDEVPMVVKAQCELGAISTWARKTFPNDDNNPHAPLSTMQPSDSTTLWTSMATHIKSQDTSSITFTGLTKYTQKDTVFNKTSKIRFIADGKDVAAEAITANDPVVYITSNASHMTPNKDCNEQHCSIPSTTPVVTLLAVVKLSMSFEHYDQLAWQSLAERTTCMGNPGEDCLVGYAAGVDIYQGSAAPKNGESQMKEIQGIVTEINGTSLKIRSSSGAIFDITAPTDVIGAYNTKRASQYYNNQTVKVGSTLVVAYVESLEKHTRVISPSDLRSITLRMEIVGKSDPLTSY